MKYIDGIDIIIVRIVHYFQRVSGSIKAYKNVFVTVPDEWSIIHLCFDGIVYAFLACPMPKRRFGVLNSNVHVYIVSLKKALNKRRVMPT